MSAIHDRRRVGQDVRREARHQSDDLENPRLIRICDPNKLGFSCDSSKNPPLPGWIMIRVAPDDDVATRPTPANRRRRWQALRADS